MGVYLNPGNDAFAESLNSEIYVDKSNMIHYTNRVLGTKQKFICISRPRRFGKSITAEMLSAYYDSSVDSHPLFSKLKIAVDSSFEQNINKYDVLFFNIQSFLSRSDCALNMVEYLEFRVIQELAERYPDLGLESEPHLTSALEKIYSVHRKGFVFIIDEWDCVFREKKSDVDAQTKYLDFLRDLLKDKVYVKLAYMTGILPTASRPLLNHSLSYPKQARAEASSMGLPLWLFLWISTCIKKAARPLRQAALRQSSLFNSSCSSRLNKTG